MILVWTYWHTEQVPPIVEGCLHSWRRHNTNWQIECLNYNSMLRLIQQHGDRLPRGFAELSHPHQADYFRLWLLYHFGGLWLDATILSTAPLKLPENSRELCGFSASWSAEVMENWAIYAPRARHSQVGAWLQEYSVAIVMGFSQYQKLFDQQQNISLHLRQKVRSKLPYLTQHACFVRAGIKAKYLADAREGPFEFFYSFRWKHKRACRWLGQHRRWLGYPLIKFTSQHRKILEPMIAESRYRPNSLIGQIWGT